MTHSCDQCDTPCDIHINSHLPPPWYRPPPGITKGPTRILDSIIFGFLIDNEEGRAWFKRKYDYELKEDHSEDLGIAMQLDDLVIEEGIAFGCCPAPRRLELVSDVLVITQIERGPFIHDGPETYEEVLQEDRRPIPGVKEEKVKAWLEKEGK